MFNFFPLKVEQQNVAFHLSYLLLYSLSQYFHSKMWDEQLYELVYTLYCNFQNFKVIIPSPKSSGSLRELLYGQGQIN